MMSVKTISRWFKFAVIMMTLMCLGVQCALSLIFLVSEVSEIHAMRIPWLLFIWVTAIPIVFAVLGAWKTAVNIGKNRMFCHDNARYLHMIAMSAAADCAVVSIGNISFLLANINHPTVCLASGLIVAVGLAILIAAEGLSQLMKKAARLQDDADLTI